MLWHKHIWRMVCVCVFEINPINTWTVNNFNIVLSDICWCLHRKQSWFIEKHVCLMPLLIAFDEFRADSKFIHIIFYTSTLYFRTYEHIVSMDWKDISNSNLKDFHATLKIFVWKEKKKKRRKCFHLLENKWKRNEQICICITWYKSYQSVILCWDRLNLFIIYCYNYLQ